MSDQTQPNFPDNTERTVVIGRTGTGKTVAGLWHLSNYDLSSPWVIFNFKGDEHVESIKKVEYIGFDYLPTAKDEGLFVINASILDLKGTTKDSSKVDQYLMKLWQRENIGVFIDEAYMLKDSDALVLCLTQGRSKHIPMILCTQRPTWITRFAFSEASFIQVFDLNDSRDIDTVESFVPLKWDDEAPLKKYESWYYEIAENKIFRFKPVPGMDTIRAAFDHKLRRRLARL